jgi:hypothetical protein
MLVSVMMMGLHFMVLLPSKDTLKEIHLFMGTGQTGPQQL